MVHVRMVLSADHMSEVITAWAYGELRIKFILKIQYYNFTTVSRISRFVTAHALNNTRLKWNSSSHFCILDSFKSLLGKIQGICYACNRTRFY